MQLLDYTITSFEKLPLHIYKDPDKASVRIAAQIANCIKQKQSKGQMAVLGLATGSSPIAVYKELVRLHKQENLSFKNVITFNLDEYYPMDRDALQSYWRFMHQHLFDHVDIVRSNIYIPDGGVPIEKVSEFCREYEKSILDAGGIDIQLLGIGRTGHIGFNEPGSAFNSPTRLVKLDPITIADATKDFIKEEYVPLRAITMGVGSIMRAHKVILMAWGEGKAEVVRDMVEGNITAKLPASFLQQHKNVTVYVDENAALELTRIKTPWLVGSCDWDEKLIRRAVVWLSLFLNKPILKLTVDDYKQEGLSELLVRIGTAYELNIQVYKSIQNTITGWPGGKKGADDINRPERANPFPKRSLIFSPHPDDDVISMGGTLLRLSDQGHDVHVAYQTSGNIAVFDDDALRFADFAAGFAKRMGLLPEKAMEIKKNVASFLNTKKLGEEDNEQVRDIKELIRRGEATAACRFCGIEEENAHFLNMPFYETGQIRKKPLGEADIQIIVDLLTQIKPQQIFAAGDLRDPHGTHAVCLDAIFKAIDRLKNEPWMQDCFVWLYRGAWHEWDVEDIDMAVPISPEELLRKRKAIFKHQSQKDSPVFPGNDKREFWQRAEDRNRSTARLFDRLGLAEYEAIEAFKRYEF
ncbi:glucosamine-6-phosphate deaminase [Mucilaginibacter sp. AW1-3]